MQQRFEKESFFLRETWSSKDKQFLKTYLVEGLHDPRTHMQSILTRHFLIRKLFGNCFDALTHEEIAFAVIQDQNRQKSSDLALNTYEHKWNQILSKEQAGPLGVLEIACGSANDYRFYHSYGLARFLNYKGIDIAKPNIENAKELFPHIDFEEGDVLNLSVKNEAFDYVVVHDLFEHLSLDALEFALQETCRAAKKGMVLAFFNMSNDPEHFVVPRKKYYWNQLSHEKILDSLSRQHCQVETVEISSWLADHFDYYDYHNFKGYTLFCTKL